MELRIPDQPHTWRIVLRVDSDVLLILEVFDKKTQTTPNKIIGTCKKRISHYDRLGD